MVRLALLAPLVAAALADDLQAMAKYREFGYKAVITMSMPYLNLKLPMRVLTRDDAQKIIYHDGLQVDHMDKTGTYKFVYENGERGCLFTPATPVGPQLGATADATPPWVPINFLPDISLYTRVDDELVGGRMCRKYVLNVEHGTTGTMNDHIAFYWDAISEKPVRWHMHSRNVIFSSHTDEYIFDYDSLSYYGPTDDEMILDPDCANMDTVTVANAPSQMEQFLKVVHSVGRPSKAVDDDLLFRSFLHQHGKAYASAEEHQRRHQLFHENVQLVKDLNVKHAGKTTFKGNQFLDMTKDEVMSFRGGKNKGPSHSRRTPEQLQYVRTHVALNASRETDLDWRTKMPGIVGKVKDQGMCGSCWTYGATEPIESRLAIQTGVFVELPEQFIVDCTWTTGTGFSNGNFGCNGGDSDIGILEVVRKFGGIIPSAASYGSYLTVNGFCKDTKLMDVGGKVVGWTDIAERDMDGLLDAVAQGPINVNIQVPEPMVFYDSGVLDVPECQNNKSEIDHAVVCDGWGTDENGVDYYLIRNSWSTYWGDQGYIKIARGDRDCAVSSLAGYADVTVAAEALSV